jgi:hypothetical protein
MDASFKEKGAGLEKENGGGRRALWAGSPRQGGAGASPKIVPEPLLMDGYPGYPGYLPIDWPFFEDIHFSGVQPGGGSSPIEMASAPDYVKLFAVNYLR